MAKQTDGINGGYRGRVGSAVGYMWRGQWCVRATPRFFHDAKTEAQLGQRALFKATVAFAGRVKEVLRVGFHQPALDVHKTECNYFLQINKGCFGIENGELRTENEATLVVDYPSLVVSQGPVAPVGFGAATPTPPFGHPSLEGGDGATRAVVAHPASSTSHLSALTFHLEKNPEHRRANADDKVFVALFCAETGEAMLSLPAYRRSKAITVVLPDEWVGMEVHLYGFVQDNNGRTSDSVYLGEWSDYAAEREELVTLDIPEISTPALRQGSTGALLTSQEGTEDASAGLHDEQLHGGRGHPQMG